MTVRPRYAHIVWDWNGTLLDDTWLCVDVLNGLLGRRGRPGISLEVYRTNFNFPVIHFYNYLGFEMDGDSFDHISREFIGDYEARWLQCSLHTDTDRTLAALGEAGVTHSMLSAAKQEALDFGTRHFGIDHYFERVIGQDNIHALGKVEKGRALIESMHWDRKQVLLVGDTLHDYEVAEAMGVDCVLLSHGHHPSDRLATVGAPILHSLNDVLRLVTRDTLADLEPLPKSFEREV